jgi:acyl-CoA thioesterase FadM
LGTAFSLLRDSHLIFIQFMEKPLNPMVIDRRITFSQTDAAGLIHFTTYFTLMEEAEAALFRELGIPLLWESGGFAYGFPRVDCQCKFRRPVGFDAPVRVELSITDIEGQRIFYVCRFLTPEGEVCASGRMVTAFAKRDSSGALSGAEMPESTREALESWKKQVKKA